MTKFHFIAAALTTATLIPAAGLAQTTAIRVPAGFDRIAIEKLGGPVRAVTNWQAYGLDPLPVGFAYGRQDSRIVVVDATGAVVDIVRVISDLGDSHSGMSF